jgi:hypothetical protein
MTPPDQNLTPNKTQVPRQFLGYGLQYTRMLSLLLESHASAFVSLELFEDVGVQHGEKVIASQAKSSASTNAVGDRAKPFWKTLSNWLNAIEAGRLSVADTVFELCAFGPFDGEICTLFSEADSEPKARMALSRAEALLNSAGKPLPSHVSAVLESDRPRLVSLITHFRYKHGSGSSEKDIREQFGKGFVPAEFLDKAVLHALGWVKQQVDSLIEKDQPVAISVGEFRKEISTYVQSLVFCCLFC